MVEELLERAVATTENSSNVECTVSSFRELKTKLGFEKNL